MKGRNLYAKRPGYVEQPTVDDRQPLVLEESATVVEESHLREVLPFIKTSYSRLPIFAGA